MGRKLQGSDTKELWYGVEDSKKRKRLQDRLAQRARRRRLAAARDAGSRTAVAHINGPILSIPSGFEDNGITSSNRAFARAAQHFATRLDQCVNLSHDCRLLIDPCKPAWKAFDANGQRMGINWICIGMVCSWRHPPDLPDTLQPTPLQLTTPHPIWLDRLPFPRLRDNVILLIQMINLEEFYVDLFMKESFHVDQTKEPHDISAYYIQQEFRDKWGYLCL